MKTLGAFYLVWSGVCFPVLVYLLFLKYRDWKDVTGFERGFNAGYTEASRTYTKYIASLHL